MTEHTRCPHCGLMMHNRRFRCQHCQLLSHVTVVCTGPTLSLKSTTTFQLHRQLKIGLVEAAYYGAATREGRTDETLRLKRRERVKRAALVYADDGLAVIIDAAFHRKADRLKFVRDLRASPPNVGSPNEVICLCCYCFNPEKRRARMKRRNQALNDPIRAYDALEVQESIEEEAEERLAEYEMPTADEPYPILFFDTDTKAVILQVGVGAPAELRSFMEELKDAIELAVINGVIS